MDSSSSGNALKQHNADSILTADFTRLLRDYPEAVSDRQKFAALLKDFFPRQKKQANLLSMLYNFHIAAEIEAAESLDQIFARRFEKRMADEYATNKDDAKWAVAVWCEGYGKGLLGKSFDKEAPLITTKPDKGKSEKEIQSPSEILDELLSELDGDSYLKVNNTNNTQTVNTKPQVLTPPAAAASPNPPAKPIQPQGTSSKVSNTNNTQTVNTKPQVLTPPAAAAAAAVAAKLTANPAWLRFKTMLNTFMRWLSVTLVCFMCFVIDKPLVLKIYDYLGSRDTSVVSLIVFLLYLCCIPFLALSVIACSLGTPRETFFVHLWIYWSDICFRYGTWHGFGYGMFCGGVVLYIIYGWIDRLILRKGYLSWMDGVID